MKEMRKARDVDEYIAKAPKKASSKLKDLRRMIRETAPEAEEKISYGMPYYSYYGRLAYFAYFRDHISLFAMPPIPNEYKEKLRVTGKATIQFSFNEKLPATLLRKLIKLRVKINEEKARKKSTYK